MTQGWHWYVAIFVIANILACLWLIAWTTRQGDSSKESMDTLDHTWDGDLKERNNPLPRWWLYLFVGSIVWGFGYLVWYPGLGDYKGMGEWSQVAQYNAERERVDAIYQETFERFAAMDLQALTQDDEAMTVAGRLFGSNCATCHGSDARGAVGFPNLTDADWQWGGDAQTVRHTIANGRSAAMPPWGAALGDDGVAATVAYVQSLSGQPADSALVTQGEGHFKTMCSACHGATGEGMQMLGAPNLTDDVWLYGGDAQSLAQTIASGRSGNMPAHSTILSENEITLLTAFVLSKSRTIGSRTMVQAGD